MCASIRSFAALAACAAVSFLSLGSVSALADPGPTLAQIDMSDTFIGGWTTANNNFTFHLFVIEGTDPNGAFVNSGTDVPISIQLTPGIHDLTLVGNDGAGSAFHNLPQITLTFADSATIVANTGSPTGSTVSGGFDVNLLSFTYSPFDLNTGFNRVNDHSDTPNGPEGSFQDTIAHIELQVVPEPASLALFGVALAGLGFSRRRKAR